MHCRETQGFGQNANSSYAGYGFKGHTGYDESCGYGSTIVAYKTGIVYKIIDDQHPANDGSGYWAVCMLVWENGEWSEWQYGHCSEILVKEGQWVLAGDDIAKEGNRGRVFAGGREITLAMQKAGDKRGSHRHIQKRPVERVDSNESRGQYLTAWSPGIPSAYRDVEGFYYKVKYPNNGYAGCVPPFKKTKLEMTTFLLDLAKKLLKMVRG